MGEGPPETLIPYIAVASLLFLLATLRGWKFHDQGVDRVLTLVLILAAAIVAAAVDLGTDAPAYRVRYEQLTSSFNLYTWWDPGFVWIALLFLKIGAPYGALVFALVLISHLLKLHVYDNLTRNTSLAFFALFCFNLAEVAFVRQYLAASLILLSFYQLSRRQVGMALLSIFAATLIHKTAFPVGILVLLVHYGRAALKPGIVLVLAVALVVLMLPEQTLDAIVDRMIAQLAAYTVEGYVQGLQDEDTSLLRNIAKFGVYIAIALWMVILPAHTAAERLQRSALYIVFILCGVSLGLIAISPVFSRFSVYVFPFLALGMRAERFAPDPQQLPVQSTVVAMLLANLVISTYPLLKYL